MLVVWLAHNLVKMRAFIERRTLNAVAVICDIQKYGNIENNTKNTREQNRQRLVPGGPVPKLEGTKKTYF